MENEYTQIEVAALELDVPVDDEHVRRVKASLEQIGQITPLIVWAEEGLVADGFHRLEAVRQMGWEYADCKLVSMTQKEFEDVRITSALLHRGVEFGRVALWCRQSWEHSRWALAVDLVTAVGLAGGVPERHQQPLRANVLRSVSEEALRDVVEWVDTKCETWGIGVSRLFRIVSLAAKSQSWQLTSIVGTYLSEGVFAAVVENVDTQLGQETVAAKAYNENASAHSVLDAFKIAHDPLTTITTAHMTDPDVPIKEIVRQGRSQQEQARNLRRNPKVEKRYEAKRALSSLKRGTSQVVSGLEVLGELMQEFPDLEPRVSPYVDKLANYLARHYHGEKLAVLELAQQVEHLRRENAELQSKIAALRDATGIARSLHHEQLTR